MLCAHRKQSQRHKKCRCSLLTPQRTLLAGPFTLFPQAELAPPLTSDKPRPTFSSLSVKNSVPVRKLMQLKSFIYKIITEHHLHISHGAWGCRQSHRHLAPELPPEELSPTQHDMPDKPGTDPSALGPGFSSLLGWRAGVYSVGSDTNH